MGSPFPSSVAAATAKSLQSCPTLCDPIDSSPPGSPVPGGLQARTPEWVAISFSNAWKWKVKGKSLSRASSVTPSQLSTSFKSSVLKVQMQKRREASASPLGYPRHLAAVPSLTWSPNFLRLCVPCPQWKCTKVKTNLLYFVLSLSCPLIRGYVYRRHSVIIGWINEQI